MPPGEPKTISLQTSEAEIAEQTRQFLNRAGQEDKICMDFELHVTAISVTLPPMNLVDLPGIISIDPTLKQQTEELLKRYVQASSKDIFLAVSSASSAPSDWTSIRLVREHGLGDRTIGVITNCDRLLVDDDEDQLLRSWLGNQAGEGFVPLEPHGYVAVANLKCRNMKSDESYADWMRRRAKEELRVFTDTLQMQDCVDEGKASMQALLDRIGKMYSMHVINHWLPLTAKKLMQVWYGCCKELEALGLPRSSGDLEGEALRQLKDAALAEVRSRLEPVVSRTRSFFQAEIAKPMQDYLFKQFGELEETAVNVLELDLHLRNASQRICQGLPLKPLPAGFPTELREMMSGLLDRREESAFKLERLPGLARRLQQNLHAQMPKLEVDKARAQITEFLKKALTPEISEVLKAEAVEFPVGTVKLKVDKATVSMVCLNFLGKAFQAISTDEALEERILVPALKEQEQETCHHARERIYLHMGLCAKSLLKLMDMHQKHTDTIEADLLQKWWPKHALGPVCVTLQGNHREHNGFREEACNPIATAMFNALLLTSNSCAKFTKDIRSSIDPVWVCQVPERFGAAGFVCRVQDVDSAKGFRAVECPLQWFSWMHVEVIGVDSVLLHDNYKDLISMLQPVCSDCTSSWQWLELLFRASRDGHSPQTFHQRCDGKGPTVVIARSQGGHIFGGFTDVAWDSSGYKHSDHSFLFHLSGPGGIPMSKHPIYKNYGNAIHGHASGGPRFGNGVDMRIYQNGGQTQVNFNIGGSYNRQSMLVAGGSFNYLAESQNDVVLTDYEVFQIQTPVPDSSLLGLCAESLIAMLPPEFSAKTFRLLFRASRDGHSPQTFHQRCDGKGPTVVIARSQGGHVFGGFTDVAWDSSGYKHSDHSFLFHLSGPGGIPMSKHPIYKNYGNAIHGHASGGPRFGSGLDMNIYQNGGQTQVNFNIGGSYNRQSMLVAGGSFNYLAESQNDVVLTDYEVFQIQTPVPDSSLLGLCAESLIAMLPPEFSAKTFRLLFRASRDGHSPQTFHQRCDGKGPTVVIARSQGGHVFGGFTDVAWDSSGYKHSDHSFLFHLSGPGGIPMSKHPIYKNYGNAIHGHASGGPRFGSGLDMNIYQNGGQTQVNFNIGGSYNRQSMLVAGGSFNYLAESQNEVAVRDYEVFLLQ